MGRRYHIRRETVAWTRGSSHCRFSLPALLPGRKAERISRHTQPVARHLPHHLRSTTTLPPRGERSRPAYGRARTDRPTINHSWGPGRGGYDAQWFVLPASAFGAPHERQRVFLIAYPHQKRRDRLFLHDLPGGCSMYPFWQTSEAMVLLPDRLQQLEEGLGEPSVCRDDDGTAYRVERLAAVGEAVVPIVAESIGHCLVASVSGCR